MNGPTTRAALAWPFSEAAVSPLGIAAAAILVMLIELVFVARIASGLNSAARVWNSDVFKPIFSDAAY